MNKWIYKHSIETPSGIRLDEVKCPVCGYCETLSSDSRKFRCYVCETELLPDDFYGNHLRDFILEGLVEKGAKEC